VWLYRDLWPGAGWGVLDSEGGPKAAYYFLKRVLAPVALLPSDEGLNGLYLHALNETAEHVEAELAIRLYRHDVCVGKNTTAASLPPRGEAVIHVDGVFAGFLDLTRAYRFGPPGHHVLAATLRERTTGSRLGEAFHFPGGLPSGRELDLGLAASARPHPDGGYALTVSTPRFAQSVAIEAAGFRPEDNYFHLEPEGERTVRLHGKGPLRGTVRALNAHTPARILVNDAASRG
jgi:beta-mannosidase